MSTENPLFRGSMPAGADEESAGTGKRPVIFDIVGPDLTTSILPEGLKLVLHVNPTSMSIKYSTVIERIQTKGGFVEQHFGDGSHQISFEMATGGFMRIFTGAVYSTSPIETDGSRRETLAYDSYLDILAMFHNNGSVYDENNQVAIQGAIKVTFDGGVYVGWFNDFSVTEGADTPYSFQMTASFEIDHEIQNWKSMASPSTGVLDVGGVLDRGPEGSGLSSPPLGASDLPSTDGSSGGSGIA